MSSAPSLDQRSPPSPRVDKFTKARSPTPPVQTTRKSDGDPPKSRLRSRSPSQAPTSPSVEQQLSEAAKKSAGTETDNDAKKPLAPHEAKKVDNTQEEEEEEEEEDDDASDEASIDIDTFEQILELDDDNTHEFSRGMVWDYFAQAATTFDKMKEALSERDLSSLSSLGHFLKGSSAALGVAKVQATCEQIQHFGRHWDEKAGVEVDSDDAALDHIRPLLERVQQEYTSAEKWLRDWYEKHQGDADDDADER